MADALETYREALAVWEDAQKTARAALKAVKVAFDAMAQARVAAYQAVACPSCGAQPTEPCDWTVGGTKDIHMSPKVSHGVRESASGVWKRRSS